MTIPDWLLTLDRIAAVVLGAPAALLAVVVVGFYLLRPRDAAFLGMAGFLALFFAAAALVPAVLFGLAAWGGERHAGWAPYVQGLALLLGVIPILFVRNAARVKRRRGT